MKLLWAIQLRAQQYKPAIQTGEALAKLDTSVVDSTYYTRMVVAFLADSQPQRAAEYAGRGVQRYPQSATAHALFAQTLRQSGQLQQAAEQYRQRSHSIRKSRVATRTHSDASGARADRRGGGQRPKRDRRRRRKATVGAGSLRRHPAVQKAQASNRGRTGTRLQSGNDDRQHSSRAVNQFYYIGWSAYSIGATCWKASTSRRAATM